MIGGLMSLFNKKNGETPGTPAVPKEEVSVGNELKKAIGDTRDALVDFEQQLTRLEKEVESGELKKGSKTLKRLRRMSMTLSEELVDLRKSLL
jgi:hypothetical protein